MEQGFDLISARTSASATARGTHFRPADRLNARWRSPSGAETDARRKTLPSHSGKFECYD